MLPPPVPRLPPELVHGATVLPSRDAILPLLPRGGVAVEVGVALGDFSRKLIDACRPARFVAIDSFRLHESPDFWGHDPAHYFGGATHIDWFRETFSADIETGRMALMVGDSAAQLELLPDASADIIYIDADHTYEAVARDLEAAGRKIKPDGWLIVNDYVLVDALGAAQPYGVIYATHEFMMRHNWALQYFVLQRNMYCDVVLRHASLAHAQSGQAGSLHAENAALRATIAAVHASTSWRVTYPLRKAGKLLKRR